MPWGWSSELTSSNQEWPVVSSLIVALKLWVDCCGYMGRDSEEGYGARGRTLTLFPAGPCVPGQELIGAFVNSLENTLTVST